MFQPETWNVSCLYSNAAEIREREGGREREKKKRGIGSIFTACMFFLVFFGGVLSVPFPTPFYVGGLVVGFSPCYCNHILNTILRRPSLSPPPLPTKETWMFETVLDSYFSPSLFSQNIEYLSFFSLSVYLSIHLTQIHLFVKDGQGFVSLGASTFPFPIVKQERESYGVRCMSMCV